MLLEFYQRFNDLSDKFRKELEETVKGFGNRVRFKFDIAKENLDPQKFNGAIIYPNVYTLDPAVFNINDPYETREGKSRSKQIGLILETDQEKGHPIKFHKVRILSRMRGILDLDLEQELDRNVCMFLLIHPKLSGGQFLDKTKQQVFSRIDEDALAGVQVSERAEKLKALNAAALMDDKAIVDFADAMAWDSTQKPKVLKNLVEEFAENDPASFNELVNGESLAYQSLVKQALDRSVISFDPAEGKFTFTKTKEPIATLGMIDEKTEVVQLAQWLLSGGEKEKKVYARIKELVK